MISRNIDAPGIQINEFDKSDYNQRVTDYSTVGTTTLVFGFADKGNDYDVNWINSIQTLKQIYGIPKTEPEKFFYNACYEVLNQGGVLTTAKLPYKNNALDHYSYTEYEVCQDKINILSSVNDLINNNYYKDCTGLVTEKDSEEKSSIITDVQGKNNGIMIFGDEITEESIENVAYTISKSLQYLDEDKVNSIGSLKWDYLTDVVSFVRESINLTLDYQVEYDNFFGNSNKSLLYFDKIFKNEAVPGCSEVISSYIRERFNSYYDIINKFEKKLTLEDVISYVKNLDAVTDSVEGDRQDLTWGDISADLVDKLYSEVKQYDNFITSYCEIKNSDQKKSGLISMEDFDKYLIGEKKVPSGKIHIIDITRNKYDEDSKNNEMLGILPVITTPINAMYFQDMIKHTKQTVFEYNTISALWNQMGSGIIDPINNETLVEKNNDKFFCDLGAESTINIGDQTLNKTAVELFPTLEFDNEHIIPQQLKQIGVVVFEMFRDSENDNRIGFSAVESFCGSLNIRDTQLNTGKNISIQNLINNNSNYIRFFSNLKFAKHGQALENLDKVSTYAIKDQIVTSLGFYKSDTLKVINPKVSILDALTKVFVKIEDRNNLDIDLIVDAGVSNIGQYIASTYLRNSSKEIIPISKRTELSEGELNDFETEEDSNLFTLQSKDDLRTYSAILQKFDDFCKFTRKDCMFIADGPRTLCLDGNQKIIRKSKPQNTINNSILSKMKLVSDIVNSSYSAGYCNWFYGIERSTNSEYIWIPPSIKALGVYLYSDSYANYWDAPAGLNRGKVANVVDIAFNPSNEEAGKIYINSWNYAISYPIDGIVLEGQKTFQTKKTALDRVSVRRLLIGLEKIVIDYCKYYNYEGNTAWLRQNLKDKLDYYFDSVRTSGGIVDYIIILNDTNNTVQTIENNELHITIAVKPVKSIEFIVVNLMCTNQSANVEEVAKTEI